MTDEMKLLRAFIEASGYEVTEVLSKSEPVTFNGAVIGQAKAGVLTDYKVTKKGDSFKSKEERVYLLKKEIEELLKEDEKD